MESMLNVVVCWVGGKDVLYVEHADAWSSACSDFLHDTVGNFTVFSPKHVCISATTEWAKQYPFTPSTIQRAVGMHVCRDVRGFDNVTLLPIYDTLQKAVNEIITYINEEHSSVPDGVRLHHEIFLPPLVTLATLLKMYTRDDIGCGTVCILAAKSGTDTYQVDLVSQMLSTTMLVNDAEILFIGTLPSFKHWASTAMPKKYLGTKR